MDPSAIAFIFQAFGALFVFVWLGVIIFLLVKFIKYLKERDR